MVPSLAADVVNDISNVGRAEGSSMPKHRVFVLKDERHRNRDFELTFTNPFEHSERCAFVRAQGRDENICIKDDKWTGHV
jgi:hypothetical protein